MTSEFLKPGYSPDHNDINVLMSYSCLREIEFKPWWWPYLPVADNQVVTDCCQHVCRENGWFIDFLWVYISLNNEDINNHQCGISSELSHQLCHCREDPVTTIGSCPPFGPRAEWSDWPTAVTGIVLTVCLWGPGLWHGLPGQQSVPTHTFHTHILPSHTVVQKKTCLCAKTCAWVLIHTHKPTHN